MLSAIEVAGINVLQVIVTTLIISLGAYVYDIMFPSCALWLFFGLIFVGFIAMRWFEVYVFRPDGYQPESVIFNVFALIIQWVIIIQVVIYMWATTALIWWLYFPYIPFVYWVVLVTFVVTKKVRCNGDKQKRN